MPAPAADIDEAIEFAPNYIAQVAYGAGPETLSSQFALWLAGMFSEATGIFPPSNDITPGQRVVTNWLAQHVLAESAIEGTMVGDAGVVGASAVIDATTRVLWAVKFGVINGDITGAQETSVVTLFNTCWS
jgi:hypothetical protein